jgi:N-acetylglucosamine-6-phosphate deacetylase
VELAGRLITLVGGGPPPRSPDLALTSGYLVPGLIDLQLNGYFGEEFQTATPAGFGAVVERLPSLGTTAFLPTLITAPVAELADSLAVAAGMAANAPSGARVLGLHLEGPFIAPSRRGAHNADWITEPTRAAVSQLIAAAQGQLRVVTLAAEIAGAVAAIRQLTQAGIVASVGHSDAAAAQVAQAADAGATMVTHLFDAQRGLHHREPGVVGQALTDPRLTSGLIADLHHVSRQACQIAFAAAPGRIALVTDAAACAGMPPGRYLLGGEPIELPPGDGVPPVRPDGTLAGSALRMDTAVANMVTAGVPLPAAVAAASRVPADLIGRSDLGRIAPGAAADLVWLGPDLRTRATWIASELIFAGADADTLMSDRVAARGSRQANQGVQP